MIYGYIRVSTDKQTVENQRYEINNFCKKESLLVDKWIEETVSGTVKVENSINLYLAIHKLGIPVEMHIYEKGGHGFGMITKNLPSDGWIERFGDWLGMLGLLKKS